MNRQPLKLVNYRSKGGIWQGTETTKTGTYRRADSRGTKSMSERQGGYFQTSVPAHQLQSLYLSE